MTKIASQQNLNHSADEPPTPYTRATTSLICSPEPLPLRPHQIEAAKQDQQAFEKEFPPIRTGNPDILIINWDEIERQFLDLCAPWEQQVTLDKLRLAKQMAAWETPEKTLRWLWVLAHCSSDRDTIAPRTGTGARYPMP
jgi:hypothetical protein